MDIDNKLIYEAYIKEGITKDREAKELSYTHEKVAAMLHASQRYRR
jgi:hypothetical protein